MLRSPAPELRQDGSIYKAGIFPHRDGGSEQANIASESAPRGAALSDIIGNGRRVNYEVRKFVCRKTCREIGAAKSFKEKVDNNDIWKVHQRAYKKYFARVSKGKMSKPDFEVWAREAERMRDEALAEDEMARDKAAHEQIVRRLTEELNRV